MKLFVRYLLFILIFCLAVSPVSAQLSQKGVPLEIVRLKKNVTKHLVELPHLDNGKLLRTSLDRQSKNPLKPFRFAEPVNVSLNTTNSGQWFETDGNRVWRLEIRSQGAKSLNLIFDNYRLPNGARLFLFSADKKDIIGAFTSINNKPSGILATSPVIGDHIVVQYEEPINAEFQAYLSIGAVNHDFYGIKSLKDTRRPLGLSGACNVNINCDALEKHKLHANSVTRLLVSGVELCTGTLINNSNVDGTPYLYSAGHCIDTPQKANESVFLFNYESPYCGEIDGDASRSLSGSVLRAQSDSLDFCLVELSVDPPPSYRPYFLGWDRSEGLPDSTVSIHHPQGDVKKIAVDSHRPLIKSYGDDYISNAFFFIGNWEYGTTEGGSSGAALINQDGRFVGSLTGGSATCENPSKDYFSRFHSAWDYYDDPAKSLKQWLDPTNTNNLSIDGLSLYSGAEFCGAFTNFTDEDQHEDIEIIEGEVSKGYWSGNNDYNFVHFAEKFVQDSSCDIVGVAMGVSIAEKLSSGSSRINIQVYNGYFEPSELIHEQEYDLTDIDPGVMNYFKFNRIVKTSGSFFISYSIDLLQPQDTFTVYLAKREINPANSFYIKDGNEWYTYQQKTGGVEGSSLLMEVVLCGIDPESNNNNPKSGKLSVLAFPNPLSTDDHLLYIKFGEEIHPDYVEVFDLMGRAYQVEFEQLASNWLSLDFSGLTQGTYLVRILYDDKKFQTKILYMGH